MSALFQPPRVHCRASCSPPARQAASVAHAPRPAPPAPSQQCGARCLGGTRRARALDVRCQSKGFGKKAAPAEGGATPAAEAEQRCPCGGGATSQPYSRCCKPYHAGAAVSATPALLLRSRFSAYCKGLGDYVVATTHPDNDVLRNGSRTADGVVVSTLAADVAASAQKLRFSDLEILAESPGMAADQAIIAFRYKVQVVGQRGFGGRPSAKEQVTESSVFLRDGPAAPWLFLSSDTKVEKLKA